MRTNVYIDGFNLYYGCLKGRQHKWLDLDALCRKLLPSHDIQRIRYFTARITARCDDPDSPVRQSTYLRALQTIPHLTVHLGHFQETRTVMPLAHPDPNGPRMVKVIKTEEKGSDVNLASHLLLDASRGDCELAVVISNDSDLKEPIRMAMAEYGVPVGLVNPHRPQFRSRDLMSLRPLFFKQIKENALKASQFPEALTDGTGEIRRPAKW
ncbi:NYN domain-containing protein [Sphaerisporangium aureirubrum]|uniref:NYN domain-containing protein n=1 Tax=Sphaerisporangium aureirubrum TaxID=1544736 RepID=A0ABW1NC29_9ACTN